MTFCAIVSHCDDTAKDSKQQAKKNMVCLAITSLSFFFNQTLQIINFLHQLMLWKIPVNIKIWVKTKIYLGLKQLSLQLSVIVLDLLSYRKISKNFKADSQYVFITGLTRFLWISYETQPLVFVNKCIVIVIFSESNCNCVFVNNVKSDIGDFIFYYFYLRLFNF